MVNINKFKQLFVFLYLTLIEPADSLYNLLAVLYFINYAIKIKYNIEIYIIDVFVFELGTTNDFLKKEVNKRFIIVLRLNVLIKRIK